MTTQVPPNTKISQMLSSDIVQAIERALDPAGFFVDPTLKLRFERQVQRTVAWEIFQGHLLDANQTRDTKQFDCWELYLDSVGEDSLTPWIAIYCNPDDHCLYVVRNILVHGWEAFDAGNNVIESRAVTKWQSELVASIQGMPARVGETLTDQINQCVRAAVLGTSRLPVTSLESPLPGFTFGQLAYFPHLCRTGSENPPADQIHDIMRQLDHRSDRSGVATLLEFALRRLRPQEVSSFGAEFFQHCCQVGVSANELAQVVKLMFNHLSLSPYTQFVDNLVQLLEGWGTSRLLGPDRVADIMSYLLRHLVRHVTAYDLVTFHNRGANYPDALLLDSLLKAYGRLIEKHPEMFQGSPSEETKPGCTTRLRRRALRQAWLMRWQWEGLSIPDHPTSDGEFQRVLPESQPTVPEQQLVDPSARRKVLFDSDPTDRLLTGPIREVFADSLQDLVDPRELRELGMAVYLDRPWGGFKSAGEVDRTVLLSYEALSRQVAIRRLRQLETLTAELGLRPISELGCQKSAFDVAGFPVSGLGHAQRQGVVALQDAGKIADDFLLRRTTSRSLADFLQQYDFNPLTTRYPQEMKWLARGKDVLLIPLSSDMAPRDTLALGAYDLQGKPQVAFLASKQTPDPYVEYGGTDYLRDLQVVPQWDGQSIQTVSKSRTWKLAPEWASTGED